MTELAQRQPSKISKAVANERPSWTDSATNPSPPTDKGLGGQGLANTGDTSFFFFFFFLKSEFISRARTTRHRSGHVLRIMFRNVHFRKEASENWFMGGV